MTAIELSKKDPTALTFDGSVLEIFDFEGSSRFHLGLITKVEVTTDKKGKHNLKIDVAGDGGLDGIKVDESAFPKVTQLIAELERAKAAFQFD